MALEHESDSALAKAVRTAGSQSAFGRIIGKRQSTVHEWLKADRPLPSEFVLRVEAATGVSRHALRPDIYPTNDPAAAQHGPGLPTSPAGRTIAGGPPVPDRNRRPNSQPCPEPRRRGLLGEAVR
jgi:DNA-binding transcriptional regulator YdaS (Cro superfamily)